MVYSAYSAGKGSRHSVGHGDTLGKGGNIGSHPRFPGTRERVAPAAPQPGANRVEKREAGQVHYWQYGLAGNSPNLAKSDPSRFPHHTWSCNDTFII